MKSDKKLLSKLSGLPDDVMIVDYDKHGEQAFDHHHPKL